jgi:outer membrane protein TolC
MKSLADRARQRMTVWMAANRGITQTDIANAEADLDQLEAMARVYGHTLTELLDLRPDPKERALIEAFRALSPENRDLAIRMLEALVPTALPHARHKERR